MNNKIKQAAKLTLIIGMGIVFSGNALADTASTYATKTGLSQEITDRKAADTKEIGLRSAADDALKLSITKIPAGPQGVKGDKGDKGDAGADGTNGTNGTNGEPGAHAVNGTVAGQTLIWNGTVWTPGVDADSCTPYHWGDTGPDGGKVFYVDGSGCHGLEAQPYDVGATSANSYVGVAQGWVNALATAAAYNDNARGVTGTPGLNCPTTAFPSLTALPATPNCWHLPSKNELSWLYEQKTVVGGFAGISYWSSSAGIPGDAWSMAMDRGAQYGTTFQGTLLPVRSVRAF